MTAAENAQINQKKARNSATKSTRSNYISITSIKKVAAFHNVTNARPQLNPISASFIAQPVNTIAAENAQTNPYP